MRGVMNDDTVAWEGLRRIGLATEDGKLARGVGVDGGEGVVIGIGIETGWPSGGRGVCEGKDVDGNAPG